MNPIGNYVKVQTKIMNRSVVMKNISLTAMVTGFILFLTMVGIGHADVTMDGEGYGFVGKEDIQSIFNWNDEELAARAHSVSFRLIEEAGGVLEFDCEWDTDSSHNRKYYRETEIETITGIYSGAAFVERMFGQDWISGFILSGYEETSTSTSNLLDDCDCQKYGAEKTLVEGSCSYDPIGGETRLEVSIDGINWHYLTIVMVQ